MTMNVIWVTDTPECVKLPVFRFPPPGAAKHRVLGEHVEQRSTVTEPLGSVLATALASFVGREELLERAGVLVAEHRLVTLVGPGGIGKTRLAAVLADRLRPRFADGAIGIALDAVTSPDDVAWRAASAIGAGEETALDPQTRVIRRLQDRETLLVVDNCEHLLEASADLVLAILRDCPGVSIIATSREPLGISGEFVLAVPPLEVPDNCADLDLVRGSEAVRLLVDRAASAGARLEVTAANCADVIRLCAHLDGMPLAIELAAARLRTLGVGDLLERLNHRFTLLKGSARDILPRHRTLEALVDWSYDLCSPQEQLLWARLAVFRDGWDLTAAESVCGFGEIAPEQVLDLLDGLIAKSVVIAGAGNEASFRMLVTMRDYGERIARETGEWETLRRRHATHLLTRTRTLRETWVGPDQAAGLSWVRRYIADIVAAMDWGIGDPTGHDIAAEIAATLRNYWASGYNMAAGRYRLERVLALSDVSPRLRCECLLVLSWVTLLQGDHDQALLYLADGGKLSKELGDRRMLAEVSTWTGLHRLFSGRPAEGIPLYRRGITVLREVGDLGAMVTAMFQLALCEMFSGDSAAATATCAEILKISARTGESWTKAYALWISGMIRLREGNVAAVRENVMQALELQLIFRDGICTSHILLLACQVLISVGKVRRAAPLQLASDAAWTNQGTDIEAFGPDLTAFDRQNRERLRRLPAQELHDLQAETALDLTEAIRLALAELADVEVSPATQAGLTKRQAQVAALLAEGLSNKEIATRLTISIRTVDGHVEQILAKFGVSSRAQAAIRLRELAVG